MPFFFLPCEADEPAPSDSDSDPDLRRRLASSGNMHTRVSHTRSPLQSVSLKQPGPLLPSASEPASSSASASDSDPEAPPFLPFFFFFFVPSLHCLFGSTLQ